LVPFRQVALAKNITTDKNIEIGRHGQYQKIISANSLFFSRKKKPFWRYSGKILQPMKSIKNPTKT
jgi:hypothetical protein